MLRVFPITALLLTAALAGGCATGSMKAGDLSAVQTASDADRVGNAYLLRGWIGIFSTGIDDLTQKLNDAGVRAHVYQDDQWRALADEAAAAYAGVDDAEPLVLIGHSYGADDVIRIARRLAEDNVTVDLLVTLDPVTPPAVPANVVRAVNLYQSNGVWDVLPVLRGVPVEATDGVELVNWNLRDDRRDLLEASGKTDHFNIEKKAPVHGEIIDQVLQVCGPRDERPQYASAEAEPSAP